MKFTFHAFFLLLLAVLQATLMDAIAVFGAKPNLFLIYVVVYSLMCEKKEAAAVGACFGLTLDILTGRFLGVNSILMLITGFFTAHLCENILSRNNLLISAIITILFTAVYESVYYLFTFSILKNLQFGIVFARVLGCECLYNAVFSVIFYFIIKRFSEYTAKNIAL